MYMQYSYIIIIVIGRRVGTVGQTKSLQYVLAARIFYICCAY